MFCSLAFQIQFRFLRAHYNVLMQMVNVGIDVGQAYVRGAVFSRKCDDDLWLNLSSQEGGRSASCTNMVNRDVFGEPATRSAL